MFRSRLSLLLIGLMLFGILAGCAPPAAAPADDAAGGEATGELVPVTYTYASRGIPQDLEMVQDAMNEIINEKIGVDLTLEPIDFAAYNDKMQLRLAAGEECDLIFTAPWINSYANNIANGALTPLDDLLPEYAPGLWASMPETTWNAARVNGTIYGATSQQIFPKPWGVHPRADLLEKYDFSLDDVTRYEDMEPFLIAVRDGEGITPVYGDNKEGGASLWRSQYWGFDPLDDGIGFMGMYADDESLTPVNFLETPEFKESSDLTKHWYDEGFFPAEPATQDEARAAMSAGQFGMGYHVEKPGNEVEAQAMYGYEFESKNLTDPLILDTAGATSTMSAVCATSKHPEAAVQVMELFNTDADVYNLLARGIQDVHWVWADEENKVMTFPEGKTAETNGYNPNTDWMFGNQFNAYYREAAQVGAWEKTKVMNDTAYPSQALGFVVDREPIKAEIAQTTAVWEELVKPIYSGWVSFDEMSPEAIEKLNEAGAQTVIDEVARQLQEWKASNE